MHHRRPHNKNKLLGAFYRTAALIALAAGAACASAAGSSQSEVVVHGGSASYDSPAVSEAPLLSREELEELVGPVALYPDDLLAIVLPASAYPLQVVQAARFLEDLEENPDLQPRDDWDESVVALLNYPDVLRQMSEDLDWTWELGQAVLNQQEDLIAAVTRFRQQAHRAGNLKSDDRQRVVINADVVEIHPADPKVIYVPRYEPAHVRVYHSAPIVHYYPRPYPVYYYPYPADFYFGHFGPSVFWGVTSAFSIGWHTSRVHFFVHQHRRHPYYGRVYYPGHRYFTPRIVHHHHYHASHGHHASYWRPREHRIGPRPVPRDRSWSRAGSREHFVPGQRGSRHQAHPDRQSWQQRSFTQRTERERTERERTERDGPDRERADRGRSGPTVQRGGRQAEHLAGRALRGESPAAREETPANREQAREHWRSAAQGNRPNERIRSADGEARRALEHRAPSASTGNRTRLAPGIDQQGMRAALDRAAGHSRGSGRASVGGTNTQAPAAAFRAPRQAPQAAANAQRPPRADSRPGPARSITTPQQSARMPQQSARMPQQSARMPQQSARAPQLARPEQSTSGPSRQQRARAAAEASSRGEERSAQGAHRQDGVRQRMSQQRGSFSRR